MYEKFSQMPDSTRLWPYALDRKLDSAQVQRVDEIMSAFLPEWNSHGASVIGAYELIESRFLLIAGYCVEGIGGCSTDASVNVVQEIERATGVNAFDRSLVFFRDGGNKAVAVSRSDFKELVRQRHISPDTLVFDTTIQSLGDLRKGRFETPFEKSWHARAFG